MLYGLEAEICASLFDLLPVNTNTNPHIYAQTSNSSMNFDNLNFDKSNSVLAPHNLDISASMPNMPLDSLAFTFTSENSKYPSESKMTKAANFLIKTAHQTEQAMRKFSSNQVEKETVQAGSSALNQTVPCQQPLS